MNLDEIQQIFFQECEEALLAIEGSYALCQKAEHDSETINTIFRGVHSIKGGAGAFGHEALQSFTHHYETLLDKLRNGEVELTPALLNILLAAFDTLSDHIAAAKGEGATPADADILARLAAAAGHDGIPVAQTIVAHTPDVPTSSQASSKNGDDDFGDIFADLDGANAGSSRAPGTQSWCVDYTPGTGAFDHGSEPLLLLRELRRMGGVVSCVGIDAVPELESLDAEQPMLSWTVRLPSELEEEEIRGVFDFIGNACKFGVERERVDDEELSFDVEDIIFDGDDAASTDDTYNTNATAPVIEQACRVPPMSEVGAAIEVKPESTSVAEPVVIAEPAGPAAGADVTPARGSAAPNAVAAQTIRVDLDKLDRLVNLVGELVITQAMLAQRLSSHGLANVTELIDLDHLTRELQDSAMSIRAQPVKTVFSRVPRIIRELEGHTGKRVRLETGGEMTEIDKTVVERIGEPLTHLIRNAVDHGLETPDERIAAGKPPEGVVRLSAEHRSGRIVISIADDGRGINRERVRAKAMERGIISADASLTNDEIDNLIFAPGFSTAEQVSNISGRGVGMDVVRKNVQALGGRIGIVSTPGEGSIFSLSLPLTLAVLDGMIVRIGSETFVIPLTHIVESLRPAEADVRRLGASSLLNVRGDYLPIQHVGAQLGIPGGEQDPAKAVLIVVESDVGQGILMVDAIQDQRQVVVKSLEANYRIVPGLAGATILGDGRVALILDVDTLVTERRLEGRRAVQPNELAA